MIKLSQDTEYVVKTLKAYSKSGLRKENDLAALLEFCAGQGDFELMQKLMQGGAALRNLSGKLQDSALPEDAAQLVQREFQQQLEWFRGNLMDVRERCKSLESEGWQDWGDRLDDIYLEQTKGSVLNLIDLAIDLYLFKTMQMEHRESRKDS